MKGQIALLGREVDVDRVCRCAVWLCKSRLTTTTVGEHGKTSSSILMGALKGHIGVRKHARSIGALKLPPLAILEEHVVFQRNA